MNKEEFKKALKESAQNIGIALDEQQLEALYEYKQLVLKWNEKINLTAITEDNEFITKHLVDSLTINKFIEKDKTVIDIGTGAGFPGIPIKIANPDSKIVLFDSLNKRIKVLEDIVKELKLEKVELIHGRAEETFNTVNYREKYDISTSRAVASLNVLVELMLPAVKVGGICICMKGNNVEEELKEAKKAIEVLGGTVEKIDKVVLPNDIERNIVIIRKIKNTPKKYPRKPGTPKKEPIK